ncbi:MAG: NADH-quinone oxidoreductase subunit K [Roseinatronobacter sp.]
MMPALTPELIYGLTGIAVFAIGLIGALSLQDRLRRVLALKLCSVGAGFLLVVAAWRVPPAAPDPVPHALVITGIVVMISATAVALALIRRLQSLEAQDDDA